MKIRIAFLIPTLGKGGAERVLLTLTRNLDTSRFEVYIFCLNKSGELLVHAEPSITICNLDCPRAYLAFFSIRKHIKQYKPHILVSWLGNLNAILSFFIPFLPTSTLYMCRESNIPTIFNKQYRFPSVFNFLYRFMGRYQSIICQTKAMATDLVKNFQVKEEKIHVIGNPVKISENIQQLPEKDQHFLHPGDKVLLFVGRFSQEKGLDRLLSLIKIIKDGYKLFLVGYGPYEKTIKSTIEEHKLDDRIRIVTDCNDPSAYYAKADCIVMTSYVEGMPNVLLEAFSWGCPAVVYKTLGGVQDIITNETGIYISPGSNMDIDGLMDVIVSVCNDTETFNRAGIIQWVRQHHGTDMIVTKYMETFEFEWQRKKKK